jgi:hypothetical protein
MVSGYEYRKERTNVWCWLCQNRMTSLCGETSLYSCHFILRIFHCPCEWTLSFCLFVKERCVLDCVCCEVNLCEVINRRSHSRRKVWISHTRAGRWVWTKLLVESATEPHSWWRSDEPHSWMKVGLNHNPGGSGIEPRW